jgi:hypothetical protein
MSNETNNSKPEWFQLVDSDAPSAQVRKIDKKLPAIAALVAGAIIATGSFIAGVSSDQQDMTQVVAANERTSSPQSAPVKIGDVSSAATQVIATTVTKNTGVQSPDQVGVKAPTGRDEDEDEDEDDDDDDDDDEDHRGERDHDRH